MEPGNGIEVRGLVREYKKGPRAVDGIDLAVEPGEIYGFLGPNGAGKSTTVHVLTTLLPPTAGTALVAGYDVVKDGPKIRGLIGVALQEAALDPLLTARDHLRLQATLQSIPKVQRETRAEELLLAVIGHPHVRRRSLHLHGAVVGRIAADDSEAMRSGDAVSDLYLGRASGAHD